MKKQATISANLLIFLALFYSCGKGDSTSVEGTVVDKNTGLPLEGVEVDINYPDPTTASSFSLLTLYSDNSGQFSASQDQMFFLRAYKGGYLAKWSNFPEIINHKSNNIIINLVPRDGFFRFILANETGSFDSIYVAAYSPVQLAEATFSKGLFINEAHSILPGATFTKELFIPSRENIEIYWSFLPLPANIVNSPNHSTVYINSNDTTIFTIPF